jgi:hypothetical protein
MLHFGLHEKERKKEKISQRTTINSNIFLSIKHQTPWIKRASHQLLLVLQQLCLRV